MNIGIESRFPIKKGVSGELSEALGHTVELSSDDKGLSLLIFPNAVIPDEDVNSMIKKIQPERPGLIARTFHGEVQKASVGGEVALTVPNETLELFLSRSQDQTSPAMEA